MQRQHLEAAFETPLKTTKTQRYKFVLIKCLFLTLKIFRKYRGKKRSTYHLLLKYYELNNHAHLYMHIYL